MKIFKILRKLLLWVGIFVGVSTLVFLAFSTYANARLQQRTYPDPFNNCKKIWSARGLYATPAQQNTIESFSHAFAEGALGGEIDVFFDVDLQTFVVSHDFPYNTKNGELLFLHQVFDAVGPSPYFWLDFKNLRDLNKTHVQNAIAQLNAMAEQTGNKTHIYIEGSNPSNLSRFKKAGFLTILDVHPEPDGSLFAGAMIRAYKILFYFGDYSVMGMKYGSLEKPVYGSKTRQRLGNIPIFLYHVPVEEGLVKDLLAQPAVRVLLVGRDQSVNFFQHTACLEKEQQP